MLVLTAGSHARRGVADPAGRPRAVRACRSAHAEVGIEANPDRPGEACLGEALRSEERRVGKECRSRWSPDHYKTKDVFADDAWHEEVQKIIGAAGFGAATAHFVFFQAEDGIRGGRVTGVQTCALPILGRSPVRVSARMKSCRARTTFRHRA